MKKKIGLALGSGGAKGLAHIEFLKIFDELEIKPHIIAGTSMGAFIGGWYASGVSALEMGNIVESMKLRDFGRLLDTSITKKRGLIKGKKIMELFEKHAREKSFSSLKIPLKIVATDFWNRSENIIEKGNLSDAVRASISIPGIFEPHKIGSRIFIDGGLFNPVPYDIITDCDIVIAIDVISRQRIHRIHPSSPNIVECIISSFHIMHTSIEDHKRKTKNPDILVQVPLETIGILDFHKYDEIKNKVRKQAHVFRKNLSKLVFT